MISLFLTIQLMFVFQSFFLCVLEVSLSLYLVNVFTCPSDRSSQTTPYQGTPLYSSTFFRFFFHGG